MNDSSLSGVIRKAKLESENQIDENSLVLFIDKPLINLEKERNSFEHHLYFNNFDTKSNFTFDSDSGDSVILDDSLEIKKSGKSTAIFKAEKNEELKSKLVGKTKFKKNSLISTINTVFKEKKSLLPSDLEKIEVSLKTIKKPIIEKKTISYRNIDKIAEIAKSKEEKLSQFLSNHWISKELLYQDLCYHKTNCCEIPKLRFEQNKDNFFQAFEEKKLSVLQIVNKNKKLPYYCKTDKKNLRSKKLKLYKELVFELKNFEVFSFEKSFQQLELFMKENTDFDDFIKSDIKSILIQELHDKLMIEFEFLVSPSKGDYLKKDIKKLLK